MTGLSEHFTREEFACKDGCGFDTVDAELISILESLRSHFSSPVLINDGCRCPTHNAAVGGEKDSWHMKGRAADIRVKDHTPDEVADYLETINHTGGLGRYNTFTHVDSRDVKARWDLRTK